MNQKELEMRLSKELQLSNDEVLTLLSQTGDLLSSVCKEEGGLMISGLGSFDVKHKQERVTTHPSTGKKILIPPKSVLNFQPSKSLKDRIKNLING